MLARPTQLARRAALPVLFGLTGLALAAGSCVKTPLVAPSGTVITLIATTNLLPINGSTDIIALLIENGTVATPPPAGGGGSTTATTGTSSGTPVHNGTVVTFTTTLGRMEPAEVKTVAGQATSKLIADGRSGVATITAYSGGATKAMTVNIGAAAAARMSVTASPQTLPATGGTATVIANVSDQQGNPISGVSVTFSTDAGTLAVTSAVTDSYGNATTTVVVPSTLPATTTKVTITASTAGGTAGLSGNVGITIQPSGTITLTGPTSGVTVGTATTFTVGVPAGLAASDVTIGFGDGQSTRLGQISGTLTVAHVYERVGIYTATATARFVDGATKSVNTDVVILDYDLNVSCGSNVQLGATSTLTATVSPSGLSVSRWVWDFGEEGGSVEGGSQIQRTWQSRGTKTVRVTVHPTYAPSKQRLCTLEVN